MGMQPVRLLAQGYGLAAAAAAGLTLLGGGWPGALLLFWLGGAAAVLGLAGWAKRDARASSCVDDEATALAEALRRWEADAAADTAQAAGARRSGAA